MSKRWVLIVEDEADIRRFIRMALEKDGLSIAEAKSAEEARIDSTCRRPELIIVDLGLPDRDGKDFIREFRTWSNAPVLVLSARDQEEEKVEALDAGADDYLTKPFGVPELLARVRAQLRRTEYQGFSVRPPASGRSGRLGQTLSAHGRSGDRAA